MRKRFRWLTMFFLLLAAGSTGAAPAGEAVAIVSSVSGEAKVQRPGAGELLAISLGDPVYTTDTLYTFANAHVTLLFADGNIFTVHPDSRLTLVSTKKGAAGGKGGTLVSALSTSVTDGVKNLFAPRNRREALTAVAGFRKAPDDPPGDDPALRILFPRNSIILSSRPRFRWHGGSGGGFTVSLTLKGMTGNLWSVESGETEIPYPTDAASLVPGQAYFLRILSIDGRGEGQAEAEEVYFSVLDPGAAARLADLEKQMETMRAEYPGDLTPHVILAGYYRSAGLHHLALDMLEKIAARGEPEVLGFVHSEKQLNYRAIGIPE